MSVWQRQEVQEMLPARLIAWFRNLFQPRAGKRSGLDDPPGSFIASA